MTVYKKDPINVFIPLIMNVVPRKSSLVGGLVLREGLSRVVLRVRFASSLNCRVSLLAEEMLFGWQWEGLGRTDCVFPRDLTRNPWSRSVTLSLGKTGA